MFLVSTTTYIMMLLQLFNQMELLSSKTAKYMYVFDEKDNQLSVTSKSTSKNLEE